MGIYFQLAGSPTGETGETFRPSWESKEGVMLALRLKWEIRKLMLTQRRLLSEENGRFEVEFGKRWMDEERVERGFCWTIGASSIYAP